MASLTSNSSYTASNKPPCSRNGSSICSSDTANYSSSGSGSVLLLRLSTSLFQMVRRMVQPQGRLLLAQLLAAVAPLCLVLWGQAVEGQAGWHCHVPAVQRQWMAHLTSL